MKQRDAERNQQMQQPRVEMRDMVSKGAFSMHQVLNDVKTHQGWLSGL